MSERNGTVAWGVTGYVNWIPVGAGAAGTAWTLRRISRVYIRVQLIPLRMLFFMVTPPGGVTGSPPPYGTPEYDDWARGA